ncbi:TRAP transporter substrate-binding protein DctP [Amorphus sp. MBR-141]
MIKRTLACLALLGALSAPASAEEVVLRSVSAWPDNFEFTQQYLKFVDRVNEAGKGVVQIQHVGGPEVVPTQQQDAAIRNGVFDIQMGAAAYYNGVVPEADALYASEKNPVEARESGALDILNEIWGNKLNARILAWQSGGLGFYIYLSDKPKFNQDGTLDLTGVKLRSASAYKEWFEELGGTNLMMPLHEVFTAFERGMIEGLGTSAISFTDLRVDDYINYRIGPAVWQLDILILINADRWDTLPDDAKKILTDAAIAHEKETMRSYREYAAEEERKIQQAGIEFIELEGEAAKKHVQIAHDAVWKRLGERGPENVERLREALSE